MALFLATGDSPIARAGQLPAFVGNQACQSCHAQQAAAWSDSHHGWALRLPTRENVLGNFDNQSVSFKGIAYHFHQNDSHYFIDADDEDGKPASFEVKYTVGVTPLQQYLVETRDGRLQALDLAWDTLNKRWFHLYPDEDVTAGSGLHWTGAYKNWQSRCAVCHQTDFHKNYDPKSRAYYSTWSDLTIGCEACHGPGKAHLDWARDPSHFDRAAFPELNAVGLLGGGNATRQMLQENMCGPCHSRREPLSANSTLPADHLGDHYNLSPLTDRLYFPDGQQDGEVYILGSFLQSKMHARGVTCTNCHDPHSAKLVAEGNAVCTQCHNEAGRQDFPTLKPGLFDSPAHHHHAMGSAGAQCVNCHMPERKYMVIDGRRDHFFRIPEPSLSEKIGSPDACRNCHSKETAAWAAAHIAEWSKGVPPATSAYAEAFAGARGEKFTNETRDRLVAIAGDRSEAAIVRATALRELADRTDAFATLPLTTLLTDPSDLVRSGAIRLFRQIAPAERVARLAPLLSDPVSAVRIAAAIELTNIAPADIPAGNREALNKALAELQSSYAARADFPETQMAIGGLALTMRDWQAADAAFSEAALMDPRLVEAWLARAEIKAALGDAPQAIAILTAARTKNPGNLAIAKQLAGLLINQGQDANAIPVLRDIIAVEPDNRDALFALAASLLRTGKIAEAGSQIDVLLALAPHEANVLIMHALQQLLSGNLVAARETVRDISERYPGMQLPPQLEALRQLP